MPEQIIATNIEHYGEDEINVDFTDAKNPVIHNNYQIYCCVNQDLLPQRLYRQPDCR